MIKISINDKEFEVKSELELIEYFNDSLKFKFIEFGFLAAEKRFYEL